MHDDHESHTEPNDRAGFERLLQEYVDGTLDPKTALRVHLACERDPRRAEALARTRQLLHALDSLPREEPGPGFDAAVLSQVPIERYASAPRRPERVLVLGETRPGAVRRAARPVGRGLVAAWAAYLLLLLLGRTRLAGALGAFTEAVDAALAELVVRVQGVPVLAPVVAGADRLYDAFRATSGALAERVGPGNFVVVLGLVAAGLALALARRFAARAGEDDGAERA